MKEYLYWDICQDRVGEFYLGMKKGELIEKLEDMEVEYTEEKSCIRIDSMSLWFDEKNNETALENELERIIVCDKFKGRFLDKIGIGTIPYNMVGIEYYGEIVPGMDNYFHLPDYPEVYFSLDIREFVNDKAPIKYIYVTKLDYEIETALEYKTNEELRKESIELMNEYRRKYDTTTLSRHNTNTVMIKQ